MDENVNETVKDSEDERSPEAPHHPRARVAAGELAGGVCQEMVRPLRELREDLAVLVALLDRHTGEAKGPKPLSFNEVEELRQNLADCYLRCRGVARLAAELAQAVDIGADARDSVDLNKLVETAIMLAEHRITAETEVFVDLGSLPLVRGNQSQLLLILTRVLCLAADSAGAVDGSAISVKTRREQGAALVHIADNGGGRPEALAGLDELAIELLAVCDGSIESTSKSGRGSAFEIRISIER